MTAQVHIVDHPLVQHKLTLMRRKDTSTKSFRELVHELSAAQAGSCEYQPARPFDLTKLAALR